MKREIFFSKSVTLGGGDGHSIPSPIRPATNKRYMGTQIMIFKLMKACFYCVLNI